MQPVFVLIVPLFVWALVSWAVYKSVRHMADSSGLLESVSSIDSPRFRAMDDEFSRWCVARNFIYQEYFLFHGDMSGQSIQCSAWWSQESGTWALLYVTANSRSSEFVTPLEDESFVTTSSTKDSFTLPAPPGSYIQAFTHSDYDKRYRLHEQAVVMVAQSRGTLRQSERAPLIPHIQHTLDRQMEYVRSLPLWPLRGAYWYFVNRALKANRPIRVTGVERAHASNSQPV